MAMAMLERTLPQTQAELATSDQRGLAFNQATSASSAPHEFTTAEPRPDMELRMVALLGLDLKRVPTPEQIAKLLAGDRVGGEAIPGKQVQRETRSLTNELGLDRTLGVRSWSMLGTRRVAL